MQKLNSDKSYEAVFGAEDQDGNPVALESGVTLESSDPTVAEVTDLGEGKFDINPKKTGSAQLIAKSGELLGTLDVEVEAGKAFKISVTLREKEVAPPTEG